ncbi:MAG TPA: UDP-N-acetylglucosamine 2-epimerase (non-hydrolyzing) [Nitrospira sp.]|nr:UDP-N-acetylglucosamine 2-epimerase (non-hydrolyzing) [Nitrospira sp.]
MKIVVVVGARPNFMKVAPILKAIREFNGMRGEWAGTIQPILVHTGQHYDAKMSDAFFADLEMPTPDVFLGAGSGSHAEQTAEVMKRFEPVLVREKPDVMLAVGDVNSTLACALVASKMPSNCRPAIAHVEAGLRSFDRSMPEEINRILTDQLSDFLFVTEESGVRNLRREGVQASKVHLVGNTMIDSLREYESRAEASPVMRTLDVEKRRYALLTLHRAANVDERESLLEILEGISELSKLMTVVFPAHPRTQKKISELGLSRYFADSIRIVEPLGYLDFLCLMKHARIVVTDSGGIQEETTALGIPCVTARDNTERPVTIDVGTNLLGGTRRDTIAQAIRIRLASKTRASLPELWDGRAAARVVGILADRFMRTEAMAASAGSGQIVQNAR